MQPTTNASNATGSEISFGALPISYLANHVHLLVETGEVPLSWTIQ